MLFSVLRRATLIPLLLLLLTAATVTGQEKEDVYYLSLKRDLLYGGMAAGSVVLGNVLRSRTPDIVLAELQLGTIPDFDRAATRFSSAAARTGSDYTLYASSALPLLLLIGRPARRDAGKLAILLAETLALNQGLTNIVKSVALRPRPYVFDEKLDPSTVIRSNDRAAFLSGHTSTSAAGGFFFARAFADYYPDSKLRPYAWALGAGLPALTGYLRIRAGQHYPSDVVAGYVLGAAVGYLLPALHRKPSVAKGLTLSPIGNGLYLSFHF